VSAPRQLGWDEELTHEQVRPFFNMQRKREAKKVEDKPGDVFERQLRQHRLPMFVREYPIVCRDQTPPKKTANPRKGHVYKWYFDFVFVHYKLIVEIDGGIWSRGAHGHPIDLMRNLEKRNDAAFQGFWVVSVIPQWVTSTKLLALNETMYQLSQRGWRRDEVGSKT